MGVGEAEGSACTVQRDTYRTTDGWLLRHLLNPLAVIGRAGLLRMGGHCRWEKPGVILFPVFLNTMCQLPHDTRCGTRRPHRTARPHMPARSTAPKRALPSVSLKRQATCMAGADNP